MRFLIVLIAIVQLFSMSGIKKNLDEFKKVKIRVAANVQIKIGNSFSIEVNGREKALKDLEIEVSNKTLFIERERENKFKFWSNDDSDDLEIIITTKSLSYLHLAASGNVVVDEQTIEEFELYISGSCDFKSGGKIDYFKVDISGSGDIQMKNLQSKEVNAQIKGSGDIRLQGKTDICTVDIKGSGDVKCPDLQCKELEASIYGSGDIEMSVSENLDAQIYGSGDIVYLGSPKKIKDKVFGSGEIRQKRN